MNICQIISGIEVQQRVNTVGYRRKDCVNEGGIISWVSQYMQDLDRKKGIPGEGNGMPKDRHKCDSKEKYVLNKVTGADLAGVKGLYWKFCGTNCQKSRLGLNNWGLLKMSYTRVWALIQAMGRATEHSLTEK